ncbi:sterol desaturase family protein [Solimonas marina]|uniref:Fatty acid hydroxylase n=1 Tax=Solimonas marina TaxID=2714601 RepID=A0A969W9U8_9GAMM|nr:sterol desaturase family protein [Solimonas marina]NKF23312.1 fatty acid hydroxylase [Solimonas marina]
MSVQQTFPARGASAPQRRYVSNSRESVRMFRFDWMEALSKVYWWVPPLVFVPIIAAMLYVALGLESVPVLPALGWFAVGLAIWTPVEYVLHRWAFHYEPGFAWGKRLHFIFHGVHHDYPNDAKRLVMPPSASLPIAFVFYLLFRLVMPAPGLHASFAGFLTGYLIYDLIHYALHHASWRMSWFTALKRNHMQHHFVDPDRRFGVSTPLWDYVFGTRPR